MLCVLYHLLPYSYDALIHLFCLSLSLVCLCVCGVCDSSVHMLHLRKNTCMQSGERANGHRRKSSTHTEHPLLSLSPPVLIPLIFLSFECLGRLHLLWVKGILSKTKKKQAYWIAWKKKIKKGKGNMDSTRKDEWRITVLWELISITRITAFDENIHWCQRIRHFRKTNIGTSCRGLSYDLDYVKCMRFIRRIITEIGTRTRDNENEVCFSVGFPFVNI